MTVYALWVNEDQVEGRGPHVFAALFSSRDEADRARATISPYGRGPDGWALIREQPLYESCEEWQAGEGRGAR